MDIPPLIDHVLRKSGHAEPFSAEALRALGRYRWPGNVRELQNVVEQAIWLATGSTIEIGDLPETVRTAVHSVVMRPNVGVSWPISCSRDCWRDPTRSGSTCTRCSSIGT